MSNEVTLNIVKQQLMEEKKVPNGALWYRLCLYILSKQLQKVVFFLEKGENSQTIKEYLLKEYSRYFTGQMDQEQLGNLLFSEAIQVIRAAFGLRLIVSSSFFNKSSNEENVHTKVTNPSQPKQLELSSQHSSEKNEKKDNDMNSIKVNDRVRIKKYYSNEPWSHEAGSQGIVTAVKLDANFLVRVRMLDHGDTVAVRPQMLECVA